MTLLRVISVHPRKDFGTKYKPQPSRTSILMRRGQAYFHHLHAQLVVKVAKAQLFSPEALAR